MEDFRRADYSNNSFVAGIIGNPTPHSVKPTILQIFGACVKNHVSIQCSDVSHKGKSRVKVVEFLQNSDVALCECSVDWVWLHCSTEPAAAAWLCYRWEWTYGPLSHSAPMTYFRQALSAAPTSLLTLKPAQRVFLGLGNHCVHCFMLHLRTDITIFF